jgi:hypothetical protein
MHQGAALGRHPGWMLGSALGSVLGPALGEALSRYWEKYCPITGNAPGDNTGNGLGPAPGKTLGAVFGGTGASTPEKHLATARAGTGSALRRPPATSSVLNLWARELGRLLGEALRH